MQNYVYHAIIWVFKHIHTHTHTHTHTITGSRVKNFLMVIASWKNREMVDGWEQNVIHYKYSFELLTLTYSKKKFF